MKKLYCIYISILIIATSGCGSAKKTAFYEKIEDGKNYSEYLIESTPKEKPEWIVEEINKTERTLYFTGVSDNCSTEKDARDSALKNSLVKFASYCGVEVKELFEKYSAYYGKTSDIKDAAVMSKQNEKFEVDAFVSRMKAEKWFIEKYGRTESGNNFVFYKAYVYASVPETEFDEIARKKKEELKQLGEKLKLQELFLKRKKDQKIILEFENDAEFNKLFGLKFERKIIDAGFNGVETGTGNTFSKKKFDFIRIVLKVEVEHIGKEPYNVFEISEANVRLSARSESDKKAVASFSASCKGAGIDIKDSKIKAVEKAAENAADAILPNIERYVYETVRE